jgi:hypothetical protein
VTDNRLIQTIGDYFGSHSVVLAGRGSLGIYAVLSAYSGCSLVAVPAAVCQDIIAAILMCGKEPWFCDVDPETGNVPLSEWRRAREAGARAAIVVHLYGNPANVAEVKTIFPDGLVIDDAAQAFGAVSNGRLAGASGDVGVVSFGRTKHISVGGAALLFNDPDFAAESAAKLANVDPALVEEIEDSERNFIAKFELARLRLRETRDPGGFSGLLSGYASQLRKSWNPCWSGPIVQSISTYQNALLMRQVKANLWFENLHGTGLVPIGMHAGSAPWRYACRLPGIDWDEQYKLGEALRDLGLHVSHWYLPAHWLLGKSAGSLVGAEQLAEEVFQFWLDEHTSIETINLVAPRIHEIFSEFRSTK